MPRPGTLEGDELWLECPSCGPGRRPESTKFSINRTTRRYHCFRCGVGGTATRDEYYRLTGEFPGLLHSPSRDPRPLHRLDPHTHPLLPGPASPRRSGLDRYHIEVQGVLWDAFRLRDAQGQLLGIHYRGPGKKATTFGERGLGYSGRALVADWLRLVEGPYDVVDPAHDVCLCGQPSFTQLRMLRGYPLILCPDGDLWQRPAVLRSYLRTFAKAPGLIIQDIEILPEGLDPDEVPPEDRVRAGPVRLKQLLYSSLKSTRPFEPKVPKSTVTFRPTYTMTPAVLAMLGDS